MKNLYIIFFCTIILFSCNDDFAHKPIGGESGTTPDPVRSARVLYNKPGGAVIAYDLPDNVDIQYIKAEFTNTAGVTRDVKTSSYIDTIEISGLGNTEPRTVKLYTVNRKEKVSEPVEIIINPLTPTI